MTESSLPFENLSLHKQPSTPENNSEINSNLHVYHVSQENNQKEGVPNNSGELDSTEKHIDDNKENKKTAEIKDTNEEKSDDERERAKDNNEAATGGNGDGRADDVPRKQHVNRIRAPEGVWRIVNLPCVVGRINAGESDWTSHIPLSTMNAASLDAVYFIRPQLPSITLLYSYSVLSPHGQLVSNHPSLHLTTITLPFVWPKSLHSSLPQIVFDSESDFLAKAREDWPINLRYVPTSHHINRFVYLQSDSRLKVNPQPLWTGHHTLDIVTPLTLVRHSASSLTGQKTSLSHSLSHTITVDRHINGNDNELQTFYSNSNSSSSSSLSSSSLPQNHICFPNVELLVGFRSGDILVHDPISKRITKQFNRHGWISNAAVTRVRWLSESLFAVAFDQSPTQTHSEGRMGLHPAAVSNGCIFFWDKSLAEDESLRLPAVEDSHQFTVWHQPNPTLNPVARWHISNSPVRDFCPSPSGEFFAVVSADGFLRIIDVKEEKLIVTFKSYYGGLLCVSWTPDSRFVLTGGEDDAVSVWSISERKVVARGIGHTSWVSRVVCDICLCRPDEYRIASVGQDTKILFWRFVPTSLMPPQRQEKWTDTTRCRSSLAPPLQSNRQNLSYISHPSLANVPLLTPIASFVSEQSLPHPHCDIAFLPTHLLVMSWGGLLRFFQRP
jgi:WD40 repeat protein